jgi:hypothetical protein
MQVGDKYGNMMAVKLTALVRRAKTDLGEAAAIQQRL